MTSQHSPCLINIPKKICQYEKVDSKTPTHERWKDWSSGNDEFVQNNLSQMHSVSWAGTRIVK